MPKTSQKLIHVLHVLVASYFDGHHTVLWRFGYTVTCANISDVHSAANTKEKVLSACAYEEEITEY